MLIKIRMNQSSSLSRNTFPRGPRTVYRTIEHEPPSKLASYIRYRPTLFNSKKEAEKTMANNCKRITTYFKTYDKRHRQRERTKADNLDTMHAAKRKERRQRTRAQKEAYSKIPHSTFHYRPTYFNF